MCSGVARKVERQVTGEGILSAFPGRTESSNVVALKGYSIRQISCSGIAGSQNKGGEQNWQQAAEGGRTAEW